MPTPRLQKLSADMAATDGIALTAYRANPITFRISLDAGRPLITGVESLRAELRRSVTDYTTPLAVTEIAAPTGSGPVDISFTGAQMNQDLDGKASGLYWLVIYTVDDAGETLDIWHAGKFTIKEHAASMLASAPPNVVGALSKTAADLLYAPMDSVGPRGINIFPENYGAVGDMATDDTAAIQAAVNAAIASKGQVLLSKFYRITDTITVSGTCPIIGTGVRALWGDRSITKSDVIPSVSPYLTGSGLYMTTAEKTAIHLTGIGGSVHLKDFGIRFADAIRWSATGHGIHIDPPVYLTYKNSGPYNGEISGVFVYGHDGDHYAFNFVNTQLINMANCQGYGGGGMRWETDCLISYKGNSTISQTYFMVCAGGTSHGYHLVTTKAGHGSVLNVFIRPQCITDNQIPGVPVPVQSGQKAWLMDAGSDHTTIIAPDFESTGGLSNNAPEYNLSTNVGVRLISGGIGTGNNNSEHSDLNLDLGKGFSGYNPIYRHLTINGAEGARLRMGSVAGETLSLLAQPVGQQQAYAIGGLNLVDPAYSGGSVLSVTGNTSLGGLRLNGFDQSNTVYQATGNMGLSTGTGDIIVSPGTTSRWRFKANGQTTAILPTSSAGLPSTTLWNDAGTVKIIP